MKTYVLMVSRYFPKGHSKEGQPTEFIYKIENGLGLYNHLGGEDAPEDKKIHTIRGNYDLWAKRFEEIKAGKACLSLRYWEGKPYHSKQIKFATLTKDDGIGLQKLEFNKDEAAFVSKNNYWDNLIYVYWDNLNYVVYSVKYVKRETLANNDGLTLDDWKEWFKGYDLSKPMAIIHFTNFRY